MAFFDLPLLMESFDFEATLDFALLLVAAEFFLDIFTLEAFLVAGGEVSLSAPFGEPSPSFTEERVDRRGGAAEE